MDQAVTTLHACCGRQSNRPFNDCRPHITYRRSHTVSTKLWCPKNVYVLSVRPSRPHSTHPNTQPQPTVPAPVRHPTCSCRFPPHLCCCYCCWRRCRRGRALAHGCCRGGRRLALRLAAGPALPHMLTASDRLTHTPTASDCLQQQQQQRRRDQSCPACCCLHWLRCWRRRGACSSC